MAELDQATLQELLRLPTDGDEIPTNFSEKTWVFSNPELDLMVQTLSDRAQEDVVRLEIPIYGPVKEGRYPYEFYLATGDVDFYSISISALIFPP